MQSVIVCVPWIVPRRIPADEGVVDVPVSHSRAAGVRLVLWKMLHCWRAVWCCVGSSLLVAVVVVVFDNERAMGAVVAERHVRV